MDKEIKKIDGIPPMVENARQASLHGHPAVFLGEIRVIDWWTLRCNCRWMLYPHGDTRCKYKEPAKEWPDETCGETNCPIWKNLKRK